MENEKKGKNIGYKAAVLILIALLICSNVIQFSMHAETKDNYEGYIKGLVSELAYITAMESIEIDQFVDELDVDYVYVKSIEPIGFVNYTTITDSTGDTRGFRSILYNVTFNRITKEEANGSIEIWERNYTYAAVWIFDVAAANEFKPMQTNTIYKMYSLYKAYQFYSIIYYEKIETGRID